MTYWGSKCLYILTLRIILVQALPSIFFTAEPGASIASCDINGSPDQTGLATQLAQGPNGPTTLTLPCSLLISIDSAAANQGPPPPSTLGNEVSSTATRPASITTAPDVRSSSADSTAESYSCDLKGPLDQSGSTIQVTDDANGVTTIMLPCSKLISLERGLGTTSARNWNASRTSSVPASITSPPKFIRPTVNPGTGCNLYGPIEQLGEIVVGVNLTSTTSETTVACSSYLSAQSMSVMTDQDGIIDLSKCGDDDYQISFGRSPECTAYADEKLFYRPSACGIGENQRSPKSVDPQKFCNPPCFMNPVQAGAANYKCCGNCRFLIDKVSVLYFPTGSVKSDCARAASASASGPLQTPNAGNWTNPIRPRAAGEGVDAIDGFTFTFPSTYVSIVGTAVVSDSCGVRGPTLTNPTPVAVTALTTVSYRNWPSTCNPRYGRVPPPGPDEAITGPFQQSDLECPTWGLSNPFTTTCGDSVYLTSTVGPPYNPIIIAPSELLSLNSDWTACSAIESTGPFVLSYGVYDPPRTLTMANALGPGDAAAATPAAAPAAVKPLDVPAPTVQPPSSDPDPPDPNPARSDSLGQSPSDSAAPAPNPGGSSPSPPGPSPPDLSPPDSDPPESNPPGLISPDLSLPNPDSLGSSPALSNPPDSKPAIPGSPEPNSANSKPSDPAPQGLGQAQTPNNPEANTGANSGSEGANPQESAAPVFADPENASSDELSALSQALQPTGGDQPASSPGGTDKDTLPQDNLSSNAGQASDPITNESPANSPSANISPANDPSADNRPDNNPLANTPPVNSPPGDDQPGDDLLAGDSAENEPPGNSSPADSPVTTTPPTNSPPVDDPLEDNLTGDSRLGGNLSGNESPGDNSVANTLPANSPPGETTPAISPAGNSLPANASPGDNSPINNFDTQPLSSSSPLVDGGGSSQVLPPIIPQTTINLSNPAPSVGEIINNALGDSPAPQATQQNDQSGGNPALAFTPVVVTAAGQTISVTDPSIVPIAGTTLSVGGPGVTIDGTYFSVAPSGNLIAGGNAGRPPAPVALALTFAGSTFTADASSHFDIGGQTLTPGGTITVSGTPIVEAPGGSIVVLGSSTQSLLVPSAPSAPLLTFAGSTFTADSSSRFAIDGQVLSPGGIITVSGTPIAEDPSGSVAIVGSSTQSLVVSSATRAPVLTFAGSTFTADSSSRFAIDGQILTPGGTITVSGTPVAEDPSGSIAIIGSSTQPLLVSSATNAPALTFAGSTFTANPTSSNFVIDGQTLTKGGEINVSGTPISLGTAGTDAVIGGITQSSSSTAVSPSNDVLTVGGEIVTPNPTGFVIGGSTVSPGGGAASVDGTVISLGPSGTLVVGSSTTALSTGTPGVGAFESSASGGRGYVSAVVVLYTIACVMFGGWIMV